MQAFPWRSLHLHHGLPIEPLLIQGLAPFIQEYVSKGQIHSWFFVRYNARGHHLRLRFKGPHANLQEKAATWFTNYMQQHPSRETQWLDHVPEDLLPNNSIHAVPYIPEITRYGGVSALPIAEDQFCLSSRVTLCIMSQTGRWDYSRALGSAVQLHLCGAHAMGLSLAEMRRFFAGISQDWLVRAYDWNPQTPKETHLRLQAETRSKFISAFERHKDRLVSHSKALWQALASNPHFEEAWLNDWIRGMADVGMRLSRVFPASALPEDTPTQNGRISAIHESLVHMTNNRLGILNCDEAYLGFLLEQIALHL